MVKSLQPVKIRRMVKSLRPVKIRRMVKSLRPVKIRRMIKSLRPVKIRQMVKSLRPLKIRRMVKSLNLSKSLRLVKYQRPWKCWRSRKNRRPAEELLTVKARQNLQLLTSPWSCWWAHSPPRWCVESQTCSLQVRNGCPVPSFYGQTLSRTGPAACTGPPCQEMVQIHAATKNQASAWNSTDFCQFTAVSNSAHRCPIIKPKKRK